MALPRVLPVFEANPYLNGFIFFVFLIGVVACFWQVVQLIGSVRWIESFAADVSDTDDARAPRCWRRWRRCCGTRGKRMQITPSSARSILESVATAHRRGARDHALYRQPADFPRPSGHVLWPCHDRAGSGRDHPLPCPAGGRRRGRGVFAPDGRACRSSLAAWAWPLPRRCWALPGRWSWGCWSCSRATARTGFTASWRNGCRSITRVGFSGGEDGSGETGDAMAGRARRRWPSRWKRCSELFAQSDVSRAASGRAAGPACRCRRAR